MDEITSASKYGLTIIIPALNEEETIAYCVESGLSALKKYEIPGEVLVIDNASTDDTGRAARQAGARVVREPERGYGSSYSAGIRNAAFEYCLKADADGSYDLDQINLFWDKLKVRKYDIILGSRFKGRIMPQAMPFLHRYFGTPALTWLINLIYKSNLSDINSGMRAFPTRSILTLNLTCKGMEFASEMLVKALKKNLEVYEIPIVFRKDRRSGKPHLKSFRDGWRHLRFIVLMSPFQLFFYPGIISIFLGMLFSGIFLGQDYFSGLHQTDFSIRSIFGITSFACVQNLVILGEVLILFSYISKLRLIQSRIDVPSNIIKKLKVVLSLNYLVTLSGIGAGLSTIWTVYIVKNLYANYTIGLFSPFYTKLGIFNFTIFISFVMLFFAAFFVSEIELE